MKPKVTSKVLRAVLIAAVLVVCLASGALDTLDKSRATGATDCYTAMVNFHNANMGYYTARISYFYGQPTTCEYECGGWWYGPCWEECQQTRQTLLAQNELTLFAASYLTCSPETIDQCVQARQMRDGCYAEYDPGQYSNPEEFLAVWSQRSACLEASKVHFCE